MKDVGFAQSAAGKELRHTVLAQGFEVDSFLASTSQPGVYGLNVALGWPLPEPVRANYGILATKLASLDAGLYVYPYAQTHVTVLTLVNFKQFIEPDPKAREPIDGLARIAEETICQLRPSWRKFPLTFGCAALSRQAVFIPIHDPEGAVEKIRGDIVHALNERSDQFHSLQTPPSVHTTVARFTRRPNEVAALVRDFDDLVGDGDLGSASIDELLLTAETKPYMQEGHILKRFSLR